jgi:hypothetical protein
MATLITEDIAQSIRSATGSLREIAAQHGVSKSVVHNIRAAAGIAPGPRYRKPVIKVHRTAGRPKGSPNTPMTDDMRAAAVKAYRDTGTIIGTARTLGVATTTARRLLAGDLRRVSEMASTEKAPGVNDCPDFSIAARVGGPRVVVVDHDERDADRYTDHVITVRVFKPAP